MKILEGMKIPCIVREKAQFVPYIGTAYLARLETAGGSMLVKPEELHDLAEVLAEACPHLCPKLEGFCTEIELTITVVVRGEVLDKDDATCKPAWELDHTPAEIHKMVTKAIEDGHEDEIDQAESAERRGDNKEPEDVWVEDDDPDGKRYTGGD